MAALERILVYVDALALEQASVGATVRAAARLARASGASLTLLDVVEPTPAGLLPPGLEQVNLLGALRDARLEALERLTDRAELAGIPIAVALRDGSLVAEVVQEAIAGRHELLVLGGAEADAEDPHGAVARRLARKAPCPVLVATAALPERPRVLGAVDVSDPSPASRALAGKILSTAADVARLIGGELHALHVWSAPGEFGLRGRLGVPEGILATYVREAERNAGAALAAVTAPFAELRTGGRLHLRKGQPARVIPREVRELSADLLVVGTVARSGLAGILAGNTAETLLNRLDCSLLVVKPDDFVSPLAAESLVTAQAVGTAATLPPW